VAEAHSARHVDVVRVTADTWRTYRDVRLAALIDSPRAFWTTYAEAAGRGDEEWRLLPDRVVTWLALDGDRPAGTVGLWHAEGRPPADVHLVGMWVASDARGSGVAEQLVGVALARARADGRRRVLLDVADENLRAAAFYGRLGFRPTGATGAMPWDATVTERELALDLTDP
jgi:ribosomal protein S18 acetylase RimI-like enzyme